MYLDLVIPIDTKYLKNMEYGVVEVLCRPYGKPASHFQRQLQSQLVCLEWVTIKGFHVKQLDSIFSVTIFGCVKWSHSSCFNFFNFPKQNLVLTSFIYKMNFIASKPHHYVEALTLLSFPYHKKRPINICMYIYVYYRC